MTEVEVIKLGIMLAEDAAKEQTALSEEAGQAGKNREMWEHNQLAVAYDKAAGGLLTVLRSLPDQNIKASNEEAG